MARGEHRPPPFTVAAGRVFGRSGAWVMNLAGVAGGRHDPADGHDLRPVADLLRAGPGRVPARALGRVHPRTRTPVAGIAVVWAASVALVLWGVRDFDYYYEALQPATRVRVDGVVGAGPGRGRPVPAEVPGRGRAGCRGGSRCTRCSRSSGVAGIAVVTWFTVDQKPVTLPIGAWLAGRPGVLPGSWSGPA